MSSNDTGFLCSAAMAVVSVLIDVALIFQVVWVFNMLLFRWLANREA